MRELPLALSAFAAFPQFIIYKTVPSSSRPGKTDKLPIDSQTGKLVNSQDPVVWMDAQTAIDLVSKWGEPYGVGFVFTERDPFWFLDIDGCLIADGKWAAHSIELCRLLSGCAIEISKSGTGLHLFGCGRPPAHGCRNAALGIEFYHTGRFAALTGFDAKGSAAIDFTSVLPVLVDLYFPSDIKAAEVIWTTEPIAEWSGIEDDQELIRRALQSHSSGSAFGQKASFADLWFANEASLRLAYPDPVRPYDSSSADAALAQHLAFWTGKNCERIRRLMQGSKLARDKWEREDYLPRTISGAVNRQNDVFQAPAPLVIPQSLPTLAGKPEGELSPQATATGGNRILGGPEQNSLFGGAIYITDSHRVVISGGHILKPDQFRVHFGGYTFLMDQNNERITRDPWEAFTQSQLLSWPKVNGSCFRPDLPAGAIVTRNGQTFVNTYVPVDVARKPGDPAPFLNHLKRVLPNQLDQTIVLSYMAACVQHKGIKFQWAPLLQGVEGNGKTLLTRCVAEAIGRRYVHWPKPSKLAKEFNAWMVGKIFFAVEDIYVPDARREVIEELKPMITGGDGLEIEAKGIDQISADICGNFMFNSNHRNAIKKTGNDRRFCVLFSAQQQSEDLLRDGMAGNYFPDLYRWLRADGYAIVSEFLHTFKIPIAFNPAGECQRAPISSTTGEAISASSGTVEQEVLEAVAQGLPGFNGGWISSIYFDRLLEKMGLQRKISHIYRKELLETLGYHWHPGLKDGRVNNPVLPDGGKPRLYIHDSALARQLTNQAEIAKFYEASNLDRPETKPLPFAFHRGKP